MLTPIFQAKMNSRFVKLSQRGYLTNLRGSDEPDLVELSDQSLNLAQASSRKTLVQWLLLDLV